MVSEASSLPQFNQSRTSILDAFILPILSISKTGDKKGEKKMVTLALAGPGSRLGKNMVKTMLRSSQHTLVIIARSPQPELTAEGIPVHIFDFSASGVPALAAFLRSHGVETLYSCLFTMTPGLYLDLLLLDAAQQAGCVKRFVPSEWAFPTYETVEIYKFKEVVWQACLKSGLEVTRFYCGVWTNIYAQGL